MSEGDSGDRVSEPSLLPTGLNQYWVGIVPLSTIHCAGLCSGFGIQVVAVHFLGQNEIALFVTLLVISAGLQGFLAGGIPYVLRHTISISPDRLPEMLYWVLVRHLPFCLLCVLVFLTIALTSASWFEMKIAWAPVLLLIVEIMIRSGLLDPILFILNGVRAYRLQGVIASVYLLFRFILVGLFLWRGYGIEGGMIGLVFAALLGFLLAMVSLLPLLQITGLPQILKPLSSFPKFPNAGFKYELAAFLLVSGHLWLANLLVEDPHFVTGYSLCYMLARGALAGGMIIAGASHAPLARAVAVGHWAGVREVIGSGLSLLIAFFLPTVYLVFMHGGALLALVFGEQYRVFSGPLVLVFLGFQFLAVFYFLNDVLGAAGRFAQRAKIMAALAILNLNLTFLATLWLGSASLAWVLPVTAVTGVLLSTYLISRIVHFFVPVYPLSCTLLAALPLLGTCWFAAGSPSEDRVAYSVGGCALYFAILSILLTGHVKKLFPKYRRR